VAEGIDVEVLPELGDDMDLIRSPIDDKIVVVSMKDGKQVCQFCFLPFNERDPMFASIEMVPRQPNGDSGYARVKVHGACRDADAANLPIIGQDGRAS
jgi:hypothetical protein